MAFDHSPDCMHCLHGCTHPHDDRDPMGAILQLPGVYGSSMRHGGCLPIPGTDLEIVSDNWARCRCGFCETEAMTPMELIPPTAVRLHDGSILMHCQQCQHDLEAGYRPGHNPNRRRRRARHG